MAGGGYYPIMTDVEWANAPWNEPETIVCPVCDGTGWLYCDIEGNKITEEQYTRLADEEKDDWGIINCVNCAGAGEVYEK